MSLLDNLGILYLGDLDPKSKLGSITNVACQHCRLRKRKCDGLRPICGSCFKNGLNQPCVYSPQRSASAMENQPASSGQPSPKTCSYRCSACRDKKVRCDRIMPVCGTCVKRGIGPSCSYHEPPKTLQSEDQTENNKAGSPLLRRRQSAEFPTGISGARTRKRPRLSAPTSLKASERHATLENEVSNPINNEPSARIIEERPIVLVDAVTINSTASNSQKMEYIQIPTRHDDRRRPSQFSRKISEVARNQNRYSITRSRSSHFPMHAESETIPRKRSSGLDENVDATLSEDFSSKLQQIISTRTDSTRSVPKYRTQLENRRRSYNGKYIPGPKDAEARALSFDLPSREQADQLFQSYLKWENVNLPVFDIRNLQLMYEKFWERNTFPGDPHIFYAILNTIFALGCFIIGKPQRDDAFIFYDRARNIMDSGVSDDETVSHVQVYLLSSRYLYAVDSLGPAWSKISSAVSLAQSLGLHLFSGSQTLKFREDRELTRKVWHNCMVTQRAIAMVKGLSTVASSPLVPFPTPLQNEYIDLDLSGEQFSGTERPSIIGFFIAIAKLSFKFDEISAFQGELRSIGIGLSSGKLKTIGLEPFLDLDRFLSDWKESLPSFLQPGNTHPALKNPIVLRHHNILHIQYLHTHLQLRRHFLSIVVTSDEDTLFSPSIEHSDRHIDSRYSTDTPHSITIIRDSALRCVVLARDILDILHQYRDYENVKEDEPELIPSWWDNIGYIYVCSTILIASRTCPLIRAELSAGYIEESWQIGIRLMESYVGYSHSAEKCLSAMKIMAGATGGEAEALGSDDSRNVPKKVLNDQIQAWLESLPADLED